MNKVVFKSFDGTEFCEGCSLKWIKTDYRGEPTGDEVVGTLEYDPYLLRYVIKSRGRIITGFDTSCRFELLETV